MMDQADYVLSRFREDEADALAQGIDTGAEATECVIEHGVQRAMNTYNRRRADAAQTRTDTGETPEDVHPGWIRTDSHQKPAPNGDTPER
ncbi:MAG: hypothetical protein KDA28_14255, partial [Phycisphaerales bacterium]|nr:hypothetical protein [Phycisphaerales bacterium]